MKIGIILPHLGPTQLAFTTLCNTQRLDEKHDAVIFYENLCAPIAIPSVATLPISNIWNFDGVLISTTIDNTITAANCFLPKHKFFYVWDLEWIRDQKRDFLYNMNAFRNPDIALIARSVSHSQAITNLSNRRCEAVIDDMNLNQFVEFYEEYYGKKKKA